ncbi:MAG: hypothetical protein JWO03_214 [Bacteroidetes bacterium]|nr:hypothetical protein [Bacteroidota bacterium]
MKTTRLIEMCAEIISYAEKVVILGNQKDQNIVFDTCMSFCNRARINITAIKAILPVYDINRELELSIGILLRNNLLDSLILTYLIYRRECLTSEYRSGLIDFPKYRAQLENEFTILQNDHLKSTMAYARTQAKLDINSKEKWDRVIKNLTDKYGLAEDWNDLARFPGPSKMFEEAYSHERTKDSAFLSYDLYALYSKYEHYGFFSDELVCHPKNEGRLELGLSISFYTLCEAAFFIGEIEMAREIENRIIAYTED